MTSYDRRDVTWHGRGDETSYGCQSAMSFKPRNATAHDRWEGTLYGCQDLTS